MDRLSTPLPADKQPGFGPRDIDPPLLRGYEPDATADREILLANQPRTDTMEAADQNDDGDTPDMGEPPVARLGASVGMPHPEPATDQPSHAADVPADEPDAYEAIHTGPDTARPV